MGILTKKAFGRNFESSGNEERKKEERLSQRNAFNVLDLTLYNATNLIIDGKNATIVYK